jgi:hypothetical protein
VQVRPVRQPAEFFTGRKETKLNVGVNITGVEEKGAVFIIVPSDDAGGMFC